MEISLWRSVFIPILALPDSPPQSSTKDTPQTQDSFTPAGRGKPWAFEKDNPRIPIPAGTFRMGLPTTLDPYPLFADARPPANYKVTEMSGYYLSRTPVTIGQFKKFLKESGFPNKSGVLKYGDDHPVENLSWTEARRFCRYYGGDLPSAAQLERASRGKTGNDRYGTPIEKAIFEGKGSTSKWFSEPVIGMEAEQRQNDFGLIDLAGNVWGMTLDRYDNDWYRRMPDKDPVNLPLPTMKSMRDEINSIFYCEMRGGSRREIAMFGNAGYRASQRSREISPVSDITPTHLKGVDLYQWLDLVGSRMTLDDRMSVGFRVAWPEKSPDMASTPHFSPELSNTKAQTKPWPFADQNPGITIRAGTFRMGRISVLPEEKTPKKYKGTEMSEFVLSRTPVTVGQFRKYQQESGIKSPVLEFPENKNGDDYPVVGLTRDEASGFCLYYGGDLPSAAQLERANKGRSGRDANGTPPDKAINSVAQNMRKVVGPEAEQRTNDFGFIDLEGNVFCMTRDRFDRDWYQRMPAKDPINPFSDPYTDLMEVRGYEGHKPINLASVEKSLKKEMTEFMAKHYKDRLMDTWQANMRLGHIADERDPLLGFRVAWGK